jgi:hypothetical protein
MNITFPSSGAIDLLAEIGPAARPLLASSLPLVERAENLWDIARAAAVTFGSNTATRAAATKLAEESGLTRPQPDFHWAGRVDVAHIIDWAMRGRSPFANLAELRRRKVERTKALVESALAQAEDAADALAAWVADWRERRARGLA